MSESENTTFGQFKILLHNNKNGFKTTLSVAKILPVDGNAGNDVTIASIQCKYFATSVKTTY